MVRRADAKSVEQAARIKRIFGGKGECRSGGMRGICPGNGNSGIYFFAVHSVRVYGIAAYVWFCAENGRDGVELDDGQDWTGLPGGRGLRAGAVGHLRARRA